MGALVGAGFTILIAAAVGFVVFVIGLFVGNIIVFDSIALAIIGGAIIKSLTNFNTFISILIGIAIFALLFFLQTTTVGFWIIGGLLSVVWGFIFGFIAWSFTDIGMVILYIVWAIGTAIMLLLHKRARDKIEIM